MLASALLIVVTYLSGSAWGPQVSTQHMTAQACVAATPGVAEAIRAATASNVNSEVRIVEQANGLQVVAGVSQRIVASVSCKLT